MILVWILVALLCCLALCCVLAVYVAYEKPKEAPPPPPPKKKRLRSRIAPPPSSSSSSDDDDDAAATPPRRRPPRRREPDDSDSDLRTPDYAPFVVDHTARRTGPRARSLFDDAPPPLPPFSRGRRDVVSRDARGAMLQLGREIHTCAELRLPTYRIGHWRGAPNVLMHQIDSEFDYRPMRYVVWTSQILETPTVHSRYSFVIPAQRRSYFYLCNWVLIVLMVQTMAFSVFRFSPKELETRIGTTATLFLVLVQFKLQITDKAPALSYLTLFDKYLITAAVSIFAIFIGSVLLAPVANILHVGEDALDAYLQVAIGATWVFQHYSFIGSARHAKRHQRSRIAAMGKIDDSMVELLRRTKIDVNDDGTVKDEVRYRRLLNN